MAVTLTIDALRTALRLGDTPEETEQASRLLNYVTEVVLRHAPDAPDTVHCEACIRLAAYLYDQPHAGRGTAYANALINSGAGSILLPYREHRAGSVNAA